MLVSYDPQQKRIGQGVTWGERVALADGGGDAVGLTHGHLLAPFPMPELPGK